MKKVFLTVALAAIASGCSSISKAPIKTSEYCTLLDSVSGLNRCETTEVVCYYQQCWVKQQTPPKAEVKKPAAKK